MSRQNWEVAETIFSSGASRVMVPDELIEMVQYANQAETPVIKFPKETMSFLYHSVRLRYAIVTHIFISQTEQYYLRYFQITMPAELSTYHKFSKRL
jgi:hypothetical protein